MPKTTKEPPVNKRHPRSHVMRAKVWFPSGNSMTFEGPLPEASVGVITMLWAVGALTPDEEELVIKLTAKLNAPASVRKKKAKKTNG